MRGLRGFLVALVGLALWCAAPAPASASVIVFGYDGGTYAVPGDFTLDFPAWFADVSEPSTLTIAPGGYVGGNGFLALTGAATLNVAGGDLDDQVVSYGGRPTINVSGGNLYAGIDAAFAAVNVTGGYVRSILAGGPGAPVTLSGGTSPIVEAFGPATVTSGSVGSLGIGGAGSISGGVITELLNVFFSGDPNFPPTVVEVTGGVFRPGMVFRVGGGATIHVHGSGLLLSAPALDPAWPGFAIAALTGTLADGNLLNVSVQSFLVSPGTVDVINSAPPTPEAAAEQLAGDVEALITSGQLNTSDGKSLETQLQSAAQRFSAGNTTAGVNVMNAFKNKVAALVSSRRLSPANGRALVDAADAVIAAAGG